MKSILNKLLCITLLFWLGVSTSFAQDPVLLGAAHEGRNDVSDLYQINPTTGAATFIGVIGFERVGGMAVNKLTGRIFATGERIGSNTRVLITIDPSTGAGTEIGPTEIGTLGLGIMLDLSFRSDNTLYGFSQGGSPNDALLTLDTATGIATFAGSTDPFVFGGGNGLAFSPDDTLFFAPGGSFSGDDDAACDSSECGSLSTLSVTGIPAMRTFLTKLIYTTAFDDPPNGRTVGVELFARINAMDFHPDSGILYGSVIVSRFDPFFGQNKVNSLAIIDTTMGNVSQIGLTVDGLDALAWVRPVIRGSVGISSTDIEVKCHNETTGQQIIFELPLSATSWDCVAQGLDASPGDEIEMEINGEGIVN